MAYGQFACYTPLITNGREFLGTELIEPLYVGTSYRVEFHVSLQDSHKYAVRNMGLHLSPVPHQAGLSAFLALTPQVSYSDLAFLDDKIRWIKVSGSFVAEGGERYLAIGNFNNDSNTDTISVPNGGSLVNQPEGYWDEAGYFIDDVSVIPDSIYLGTNDFEEGKVKLNLYPNPASTSISISHNGIHKAISISFYTAAGQLIKSESWRKEIGVADLPNGLYLIKAEFENGAIGTKRLLIQR